MMYVSQLLPDEQQARVLRDALLVAVGDKQVFQLSEDEKDAAYEMLTKLTADMRRKRT